MTSPMFGLAFRTYKVLHILLLNFINHAYAVRERCNYACLLVFSLQFATKYRIVLCNIILCAVAVIRWRIVSNTVATLKIVFHSRRAHWA